MLNKVVNIHRNRFQHHKSQQKNTFRGSTSVALILSAVLPKETDGQNLSHHLSGTVMEGKKKLRVLSNYKLQELGSLSCPFP
jgi:hypothetical protein